MGAPFAALSGAPFSALPIGVVHTRIPPNVFRTRLLAYTAFPVRQLGESMVLRSARRLGTIEGGAP